MHISRKIKNLPNAVAGVFLMLKNVRTFSNAIFDEKRVAIVGPADSAYRKQNGAFIDGFDYVIRFNKAHYLIRSGTKESKIGKKFDILCHNFFENTYSGGGELDFNLYDQLGIQYVLNPRATYDGYRGIFNYYKKYLSNRKVHCLPRSFYAPLQEQFGDKRPTTGLAALYMVLKSNFSECFITGFTFFRTPYGKGYRDDMIKLEDTIEHIQKEGLHDPELEFQIFKDLLKENRYKNIELDETLQLLCTESDRTHENKKI